MAGNRAAKAAYEAGLASMARNSFRVAVASFRTAIELDPDNATYWLARAEAYSGFERYSNASRDVGRALELEPGNLNAKCLQAFLIWPDNGHGEAIAKLDEIVSEHPDCQRAQYYRSLLVEDEKAVRAEEDNGADDDEEDEDYGLDEEDVPTADLALINAINDAYSDGDDTPMYEVGDLRSILEVNFGFDSNFGTETNEVDRSGVEPLDSVRVFFNEAQGGHWHYISFGFSDLYALECRNDFNASGFGFELTIRIPKGDDEHPPGWPIEVLQNLAKYVFSSKNFFEANQHMDLNSPIVARKGTTISAVAFTPDSELGTITCASGTIEVLQLVGMTSEEYNQMKRWQVGKFIELLAKDNPLLLIDPKRKSILEKPKVRAAIEKGVRTDGSSVGALFIETLVAKKKGKSLVISLDQGTIEELPLALQSRIPFGRYLKLIGPDVAVIFEPADQPGLRGKNEDDFIAVALSPACVDEIAETVKSKQDTYSLKSVPLKFVVLKK